MSDGHKMSAMLTITIGSVSDCHSRVCHFQPQPNHIIFVEIDHKIIFTAIFLFPIQEGQLSVTGKSVCTKYWITA